MSVLLATRLVFEKIVLFVTVMAIVITGPLRAYGMNVLYKKLLS